MGRHHRPKPCKHGDGRQTCQFIDNPVRPGYASCYRCGRTLRIGTPVQPRHPDRIERAV